MNSPLKCWCTKQFVWSNSLFIILFTKFILKSWRSINFTTCLCSPAIDILSGELFYWLSTSLNVLSPDSGPRYNDVLLGWGSQWAMMGTGRCQHLLLIVVTTPGPGGGSQTPDGAGYTLHLHLTRILLMPECLRILISCGYHRYESSGGILKNKNESICF